MRQYETQNPTNSARDANQLSGPWIFAGAALFVAALSAPIAVVHMGREAGKAADPATVAGVDKTANTETRLTAANPQQPALLDELANGPIVPGTQVGTVRIGQSVDAMIASVREPAMLSYGAEAGTLSQTHIFDLEDLRVVVRSDPEIGRIESLGIAALDCKSVRTFQPRQEGLPATEDGLSIGSHVTRVVKRMGPPNAEMPGEPVPSLRGEHLQHTYPGLTVRYCPEDMVVGAISVEPLPDKPADQVPLVAMIEPNAPYIEPVPSSEAGVTLSADGRIDRAAPAAIAAAAEVATPPAATDGILALGDTGTVQRGAAPDGLLALNGAGFAMTDAFSAHATGVPEAGVRYAAMAHGASLEAVPAAEGPPEAILALASETALELTARKRREIQIRLSLLGFSPHGADGIFGPKTREAILDLQAASSMPATGYLDAELVTYIVDRSEKSYARWQVRRARARQPTPEPQPVLASRVPSARNAPECARDQRGQIIENQSWSCDVTVLEESISALFSGKS